MKRHAASMAAPLAVAVALGLTQPSTGTLSGRVFALAKGGDIKPARIAQVFLASGDDQNTLQYELDKALKKRLDDIRSNTDAQESCLVASVSIHEALKGGTNLKTLHTDEDGNLEVTKLTPGSYLVVVMGGANGYQSVWYLATTVDAGKRTKVKLSEPALTCQ